MPRATNIRGAPIRQVAGQRQAMHGAIVQAAKVPAQVTAAVDEVADSLGASLTEINGAIATVNSTLDTVETTLVDHNNRLAALEP